MKSITLNICKNTLYFKEQDLFNRVEQSVLRIIYSAAIGNSLFIHTGDDSCEGWENLKDTCKNIFILRALLLIIPCFLVIQLFS